MAGNDAKRPRHLQVTAVGALVVMAYFAMRKAPEAGAPAPRAAGWHGAMELYRSVAMWAGKRSMQAELKYWEAVG